MKYSNILKPKFSITLLFVTAISFAIILISCSKEDDNIMHAQDEQVTETSYNSERSIDELLTFYYHEYQSQNKNIFHRIWKWMQAHAGTHLFENCQGNMQCGPCAGVCLVAASRTSDIFIPVDESDGISSDDYREGVRHFQIALFNDSILGISFTHDDFVYNDSLHIPEDFNIGGSASVLFEKDSIIVLQGVYPVSYTHSRNGSTIVDVLSY